jgi:hypothetical protein
MTQAASHPGRAGSPAGLRPTTRVMATVFGLDVHSEIPLLFLGGSTAKPTGRALEISVHGTGAAQLEWPRTAELVSEDHQPDGSLIFQIEAHPKAGYLISGPDYGAHRLSADGRLLRCAPEGLRDDAWQRLLIAQVLPFAALLHGLEVFHASAIIHRGEAVAFLGPSRAGKTSLALELWRRGASFLADDVLALEPRAEGLLAHPGTPVAGIAHAEAERSCGPDGFAREEIVAVNTRERLVRMAGAPEPAPLTALFFLDRRADGPANPRFEPAANAQMLLTATFNFVLATPERLRGLLDVCALAARLRVERIVVGPTTDACELGAAVEQRLSSTT